MNHHRLRYKRWLSHQIVADVVYGEYIVKELYDIRDLTIRLSNFPGPRLELRPGRP